MSLSAEWREMAEDIQREKLRAALPPAREAPWRHECNDCEDTGWVMGLTCDGAASGACGRRKRHLPHDYTVACACRATNRTYARTRLMGGGAA